MIAGRLSTPVRLAWEVVRPDGSHAGSLSLEIMLSEGTLRGPMQARNQ
jgi:hypothetical protein